MSKPQTPNLVQQKKCIKKRQVSYKFSSNKTERWSVFIPTFFLLLCIRPRSHFIWHYEQMGPFSSLASLKIQLLTPTHCHTATTNGGLLVCRKIVFPSLDKILIPASVCSLTRCHSLFIRQLHILTHIWGGMLSFHIIPLF